MAPLVYWKPWCIRCATHYPIGSRTCPKCGVGLSTPSVCVPGANPQPLRPRQKVARVLFVVAAWGALALLWFGIVAPLFNRPGISAGLFWLGVFGCVLLFQFARDLRETSRGQIHER